MSHGLCMIDRQGRLILANDKFHRIFRLPLEAPLTGASAALRLSNAGQKPGD